MKIKFEFNRYGGEVIDSVTTCLDDQESLYIGVITEVYNKIATVKFDTLYISSESIPRRLRCVSKRRALMLTKWYHLQTEVDMLIANHRHAE